MRSIGILSAALVSLAGCAQFSDAPLQPPVLDPDRVQHGALLFLNPALSADGQRSCASCHPGGGSNGRIYRNGVEVGAGSASGRKVPNLRGLWQTGPYLWDGSIPTVRAAIERELTVHMGNPAADELELLALEAYVLSIPPFDNGRIEPDGTPVEPATLSARRGFEAFQRAKCGRCHPPPTYARSRRADVGTGGKWYPPSLRGLSSSAPYGHDGRWSTLDRALDALLEARDVDLNADERAWLLKYLELL